MGRIATLRESREKARENLKTVTDELDTILVGDDARNLTPEEEQRFEEARTRVVQLDAAYEAAVGERKKAKAEQEERDRKLGGNGSVPAVDGQGLIIKDGVIRIGKEPLTYGKENPDNSFYRDLLCLNQPLWQDTPEGQRLLRHRKEMAALEQSVSKEGRAVQAYAREVRRRKNAESRDVSTVTASMGDFAPPLYWLPQYAEFRTYGRTLIDNMQHMALPASGLTFNLPKITTPTEAVNQTAGSTTQGHTENTTITTRTITSAYETGTLQTIVDNLKVSQQYLDRVGPGIDGDMIIRNDQQLQVNRTLNVYAWKKIIGTSNVGHVTYDTTGGESTAVQFTAATFNQTVHKAKAVIQKTDGTVAYPTHYFSTVDLWETVEGAFDTNNRPFVVPQGVAFNPLAVGDRADVPEGYSGFKFAGVQAFIDQAAFVAWQTVKTTTDTEKTYHIALVGAMDLSCYWLESTPVVRVLPQPYASSLTVLIQEYVYAAYVPKYPKAMQLVYGPSTKADLLAA